MTAIEFAEVVAELENAGRTAALVDANSPDLSAVPIGWQKIARSADAEERRLLALSLWNREFLELIPGYAGALRTKLLDVRVCVLSDQGPILVYLFQSFDHPFVMWIGWDPATFGDREPVFWQTIPAPARTFLREVHAGYTLNADWEACGFIRPKDMTTLAEWAEWPDGIPGWSEQWWEDCEPIDSRRLLLITHIGPDFNLCTSPDLPPGRALTNAGGHIQIGEFGTKLDTTMLSPLID